MTWTNTDETLLRSEVKRRFSERTPPRHPDEVDIGCRVTFTEMRAWSLDTLGKQLPDMDYAWRFSFVNWYKQMAKNLCK